MADFDTETVRLVFSTIGKEHLDDRYFNESGDTIRSFLKAEENRLQRRLTSSLRGLDGSQVA